MIVELKTRKMVVILNILQFLSVAIFFLAIVPVTKILLFLQEVMMVSKTITGILFIMFLLGLCVYGLFIFSWSQCHYQLSGNGKRRICNVDPYKKTLSIYEERNEN